MRKGFTMSKFLMITLFFLAAFTSNTNAQISCSCTCDWSYWNTGANATVLINPCVTIDGVDPTTIYNEVMIGAFYDSLGFERCAGYLEYTGGLAGLTIWGEQSPGSEDGFAAGDPVNFKICADGTVYDAIATFSMGTGTYSTNGIMGTSCLVATSSANLSVVEWLTPQDGCGLSSIETVSVAFWNNEAGVITDTIQVSYSTDGGTSWISENFVGTINPGDTINYSFTTPASFSGLVGNPPNQSDSIYQVAFQISFADDADSTDNYLSRTVTNAVPPLTEITSPFTSLCLYSTVAPFTMSASPAGGTWSDEFGGLYQQGNIFFPSIAGPGEWDVYYNFNDTATGCTGSDTVVVNLYLVPDANFTITSFEACMYDTFWVTATPLGGEYIGSFINATTGMFIPLSNNTYPIDYAFEDVNGCKDTAHTSIEVHALPNVSLDFTRAFCSDGDTVHLHGLPIGGEYWVDFQSSPVMVDSVFDPKDHSVGNHNLTYNFTDGNGCYKETSKTFKIWDPTEASYTGLASEYCQWDDSVMLSGNPTGGTWFGASAAGWYYPDAVGLHTIDYLYESEFNWGGSTAFCDDTASQTTMVWGLPQISLAGGGSIPINQWGFHSTAEPDTIILNASPGYVAYNWNTGDSVQIIELDEYGWGVYVVTVTDVHTCNGIDTINIGGNDIEVTRLENPVSNCVQELGQELFFTVKNVGTWPIYMNSTITCKIQLNQNTVVSIPHDFTGQDFMPGDSVIINPSATGGFDLSDLYSGVGMEHTIRLSAVFQNTLGNQPDDVISSNDSLSTIVDHAGIPDVELGADITYSNPDTVTLDAGDFLEYTWNTGALTQTIIVTSTMGEKEYCVTVTDRYGCTDEDCILVLNGIEETGVSYDEISVYPNPSSGLVTLNVVNKNNNDLKVQVIDIHGRLIEEYNYGSVFEITEEIDFTSMAKGLYYIRINNTLDLHQTKIIIR